MKTKADWSAVGTKEHQPKLEEARKDYPLELAVGMWPNNLVLNF